MSKVKNPREKKDLSLERDRRNRYRENAKASRKLIPLGKQRSRRIERKGPAEALRQVVGAFDIEQADAAENEAARRSAIARVNERFKKVPDVPLKEHIARHRS